MEPRNRLHGDVEARFAFLSALNELVPAALGPAGADRCRSKGSDTRGIRVCGEEPLPRPWVMLRELGYGL